MSAPNPPSDFGNLVSTPTSTLCGNFKNTLLRLPVMLYNFIKWMLNDAGDLTADFKRQIVRPGDYIYSATPLAQDSSRLLCDGQAVLRADYPELFAAIGTLYGAGNGTTTFNVPDFRDKFPIGVSGTRPIGSTGGASSQNVMLVEANLPKHIHYIGIDGGTGLTVDSETGRHRVGAGTEIDWQDGTSTTKAGRTRDTGPNTPEEQAAVTVPTIPPYLAVYIYIAT